MVTGELAPRQVAAWSLDGRPAGSRRTPHGARLRSPCEIFHNWVRTQFTLYFRLEGWAGSPRRGLGIYPADFTERSAEYVSRVYEMQNPPQSVGSGIYCEIHATVVGPA